MTWRNACGFLLLGLFMLWLPVLAPGFVAAHTAFGASVREAWLLCMGTVNAALGGGALGWQALKEAWQIPAWLEARPVPEPLPASPPRPARAGGY
ncbi:MAG TPA: hypothetical protein VMF63_03785 [Opitutaceae bacterium]|nr:hypothetical protein [Opitutaceae bacterium]